MKLILFNFFLSFILLFLFTYIVFFSANENFSVKEKVYLKKISLLDNDLNETIASRLEEIEKLLTLKKNKDFINHILRHSYAVTRQDLFINDLALKNVKIYTEDGKNIYYKYKIKEISLNFEKRFFFAAPYLVLRFDFADKKRGHIFFFYDLAELSLAILERNKEKYKLADTSELSGYFYNDSLVIDLKKKDYLEEQINVIIDDFNQRKLTFEKIYSEKKKKFFLLKKDEFLNLNLGFIYPAWKIDLPLISIVIFFGIFSLLIFSFSSIIRTIQILLPQKGLSPSFFKKFIEFKGAAEVNFFSSLFKPKKKLVSPSLTKESKENEIGEELEGASSEIKDKPIDSEIINLTKSINQGLTPVLSNDKRDEENQKTGKEYSLAAVKLVIKEIGEKMEIFRKSGSRLAMRELSNITQGEAKLALLYPYEKKLFLVKENSGLTDESIDRLAIDRAGKVYDKYLSKNKVVILKKPDQIENELENKSGNNLLEDYLSPKDLRDINALTLIPIMDNEEVIYIALVAKMF